ncbi:unnamed protein product [Arabis nemorensis]|uniref:Uncharacterized protein n=1 Tax=Arabis nemorensis TaxID=586526 RepID=A0A565CMY9_9BRAS|nr:unnamed protein product [Arabis nemorensis]
MEARHVCQASIVAGSQSCSRISWGKSFRFLRVLSRLRGAQPLVCITTVFSWWSPLLILSQPYRGFVFAISGHSCVLVPFNRSRLSRMGLSRAWTWTVSQFLVSARDVRLPYYVLLIRLVWFVVISLW